MRSPTVGIEPVKCLKTEEKTGKELVVKVFS